MGRIRAPYGLKGWVNVQPFTQEIDGLLTYPRWWVGSAGQWQERRVSEAAVHGTMVVARLDGCNDRDAAAGLKGKDVAVPRDSMPENKTGEYYWSDLLGLEVMTLDAVKIGFVTKILETGANAVLVVQGEKELLVPFIEGVIAGVDLGAGKVVVDWEPN